MASTPDTLPVPLPDDFQFVDSDGVPMESAWHRDAMNGLIEQVRYQRRDRRDYFVGGNMFIYFSPEQARNRDFRGPDFFYVHDVRFDPLRPCYVVWQEGGRFPDVIIELLSATTEVEDRTTKKDVYETTFRTPEYFLYDPDSRRLNGFRHDGRAYRPIEPDSRGFLWCEELSLWLGTWAGDYQGCTSLWLRFFDTSGNVVPLFAQAERERAEVEKQLAETAKQHADSARERAETEQQRAAMAEQRAATAEQRAETAEQRAETAEQRADVERQRAEAAEAELARLRSLLPDPPTP